MTDSLTQDKDLLAASVVYDYLQQHPAFFQHYPDLLPLLRLPHQQRGSVSLVERQLELQREKIHALQDDITRLMSVARQNEHIFHALNQLHLSLFNTTDLAAAEVNLQQFAQDMPQVHACRLICLEQPQSGHPFELLLSRRLNQQQVYLGRLNKEEQQAMFNDNIHSVALILIRNSEGPLALLAFGSESDDHFQPAMDQLFIRHLAKLLALVLPGYVKS